MIRALALVLSVGGCITAPPQPEHYGPDYPTPLRFRACQALGVSPPALPGVRTIEMLRDSNKHLEGRNDELERKYLDCAERMRLAVVAYDELRAAMLRKP